MLCGSILDSVCTHTGVYLRQNGIFLANNSAVFISDIGREDNSILQCVTDSMSCCTSPNTAGNWYFPGDERRVPSFSNRATFYRDRGDDGTVNLHRVSNNVMMPTGQFCCVVPDATGVDQWACANVGEPYNYVCVHALV